MLIQCQHLRTEIDSLTETAKCLDCWAVGPVSRHGGQVFWGSTWRHDPAQGAVEKLQARVSELEAAVAERDRKIAEANQNLRETFELLEPDNDRDGWFMVRLTKALEAIAID